MKVGVIGAGQWGQNLVRAFSRLGALAAVAEINHEARERLAAEFPGVPLYEDCNYLLESDIPAVVIATPASTHYQIAKKALLSGKDAFVEKPLALSLAEARELVEIAESKESILMVGHLLLYQPAVQWIKNYLASGALGDVGFMVQERLKLGLVRAVENVLWSFGVHDIAVLLHLVEEKPEEVKAVGRCFLQEGVADDVYVHLRFPGGVQAHLHTSWLWPETRRRLTIVGARAMLVYDELEQKVTLHKKWVGPALGHHDEGSEVVFQGSSEPLLLECRHFLECLEKRETPLSDGRSAVAVLEVLEAAEKQLRSS
ncbi:MAG: Gfo/Idh/MocA family oxidoreductase [Firmicutes bacterium]|nr:Gfo/Idh/MocA family oxidoreductase [Bacillota bacterium]